MAVVGTAWVRVKLLSDKLGKDIGDSLDKAFTVAAPNVDTSAAKIGQSVADGINDGIEANAKELGNSIDKNVAVPVHNKLRDAIQKALKTASGKTATINADADTGKARAKMALASRTRRAKIIVELEKKSYLAVSAALARLSGARVLTNYLKNLKTAMLNLDKSAPKIAFLTSVVLTLASAALAAVSNVSVLAGNLAAIGAVGLTLPGIFAGAAAGAAVLVMALKDTKTVLKDLGPQFSKLQDSVSAEFWKTAEQPIRNMVDKLFPTMKAGLVDISGAFGGWAAELSKVMSSTANVGSLKSILSSTAEAITAGQDGLKGWITGFMTLGATGASYLPQLTTSLNGLGERFNDWVQANTENGNMMGWINNGIFQAQELGRVFAETGGILSGVYQAAAAAGGSTLTVLANGLDRISDWVNSEAGQGKLTLVFKAAHEAMATLAPGVDSLARAFGDLVPTLSTLLPTAAGAVSTALSIIATVISSPAFTAGISNMVSGLSAGLAGLAPAAAPLGEMLGSIGTVVGTLVANLGPVLGAAISALAPVFTSLAAAVVPVIAMLGPALTSIITMLSPLLASLGPIFAQIGAAVQQLIAAAMPVVQMVLPLIVTALQFLVGFLASAVVGAIQGLASVFTGVFNIIQGAVKVFTSVMKGDWGAAWNGIKQVFTGVWQAITGALKVFLNVGILGVVGKGIAAVKAVWSGGWTAISGVLKSAWSGIVSAVSGAAKSVVSTVSKIPSAIKGGLGNLGSLLVSAGKNVISGLINGIKSMAGTLIQAAKSVVDNAINAAKSLLGIRSPSTVFFKIGQQTGQGLVLGLEKMESKVGAAGAALADAAVAKEAVFRLESGVTGAQELPGPNSALTAAMAQMTPEALAVAIRAAMQGLGIEIVKADAMADYVAGKLVLALEGA